MSWIARLDDRAKHWPSVGRGAYLGLKWLLVAVGAFAALALAVREIREGRVGLGTGIAAAVVVGVIKGILMARQR